MLNKLAKLCPIFYKDLSTKGYNGRSYGLWIVIDKTKKDDLGLLTHERVHCRQFISTLGLHGILYYISKKYRYKAEVEAFGYSIHYGTRREDDVKYNLETYYKIPEDIMEYYGADIINAVYDASKDFEEIV